MLPSGGQESSTEIKKELLSVFIEEFYDSFNDILLISQNDFLSKFTHRINIILSSYHQNILPTLRSNRYLLQDSYNTIFEDYFLPCLYECKKTFASSSKEVLKTFKQHCVNNPTAFHTCQGKLIVSRDQVTKKIHYIICTNCKYVYSPTCILMYCPECECDFYSSIVDEANPLLQPATWERYHCGIVLNQQMTCDVCKGLFWLRGNFLYCKTCNKEYDPLDIDWVCMMCQKIFHTGAKEYNPLEFKAMKISVKNAIVNQMLIKPVLLPCQCDMNPLKLTFKHNSRCNGLLYEGDLLGKKIVVCGVCKIFASVKKFNWFCPICNQNFKTNNTRTFPSVSKSEWNDEFVFTNNKQADKSLRHSRILTSGLLNSAFKDSSPITREKNSRNFFPSPRSPDIKKKYSFMKTNPLTSPMQKDLMSTPIVSGEENKIRYCYTSIKRGNSSRLASSLVKQARDNGLGSEENQKPLRTERMKPQNLLDLKSCQPRVQRSIPFDDFYFEVEDYNVIMQLGQGTFGKIYLVEDKNGQTFCMKKLIIHKDKEKSISSLKNEYEIFSRYRHENVLKIYGISEKELDDTMTAFYILMEVGKTDWEKEINERKKHNQYYAESELMNILKQLTNALEFLQVNGIAHRDVKAQNVLVFEGGLYKIADFGEAKKCPKGDILSTLRGTELYMSPLLFNGLQSRVYDVKHNVFKSDVFSLGMCLLFATTLSLKTLCKVRDFLDNSSLKIYLLSVMNKSYSLGLVELLGKMLSINEEERPDFVKLKEMLQ